MKADTLLTAMVALCCVLAIGATSTTLDSTVSTDPQDVTEVGYDVLPIGTEQARDLDAAIDGERSASGGSESSSSSQSSSDSESQSGSPSAAADSAENGDQTEPQSNPGDGQHEQSGGSKTKTRKQQQSGGGGKTEQSGKSDSPSESGSTPDEPTLLERLLSLLRELFDTLLTVLPFAVLAVSLAVTVRYRDRLLSRVAPVPPDEGLVETDREPSPQNDVASAWFEMVESLDLADRRDLTPRQYADAARRRGVDGDAARKLTELFEEVRYGGARVTDERRRRAENCLRRVRTQLEGRQ